MAQVLSHDDGRLDEVTTTRNAVRPYDFRTGSELSREELSQLRACGDRFAAALGRVISAYLASPAEFEVTDTRPCALDEFLSAAPRHGALVLVGLVPPGPAMVFEIGATLTGPIVNRMLAGEPEQLDRAPTALEAVLLQRFVQEAMEIWAGAWARLARQHPQATEVAVDPADLAGHIGAGVSGEGIVIEIEARVAGSAGLMRVFLPVSCAQRLVSGTETGGEERQQLDFRRVRHAGEHLLLPVSVIVHQMRLPLAQVLALRPGQVIALGKPVGEPVVVSVRGRPKFIAQAGVLNGRLAARLIGPCPASMRAQTTPTQVARGPADKRAPHPIAAARAS